MDVAQAPPSAGSGGKTCTVASLFWCFFGFVALKVICFHIPHGIALAAIRAVVGLINPFNKQGILCQWTCKPVLAAGLL